MTAKFDASALTQLPPRARGRRPEGRQSEAPVEPLQPPSPTPSVEPDTQAALPVPVRTRTRTRTRKPSTQAGEREPGSIVQVTFTIDRELLDEFHQRKQAERLTSAGAIAAAYIASRENINDLVNDDLSNDRQITTDDPFDIPTTDRRVRGGVRSQLGTRLPWRTITAMDEMVAATGARDRSHLTEIVLRNWIG